MLLFWWFSVFLLWTSSPPFVDGDGAIGSLYWSKNPPLAANNEPLLTARFVVPYIIWASLLTGVCGATLWLRPDNARIRTNPFISTVALCAAAILLLGASVDLGSRLDFWGGPRMLLSDSWATFVVRLVIPLSFAFAVLVTVSGFVHPRRSGAGGGR